MLAYSPKSLQVLSEGRVVTDYAIDYDFSAGRSGKLLINARKIIAGDGYAPLILMALEDGGGKS